MERWMVDSGSPFHLCSSRESFETYQSWADVQPPRTVGSFRRDAAARRAYGCGTVRLHVLTDTQAVDTLVLRDVWHLPDATSNLISTAELRKQGEAYYTSLDHTLRHLKSSAVRAQATIIRGTPWLEPVQLATVAPH
jgi:hypothetical protein